MIRTVNKLFRSDWFWKGQLLLRTLLYWNTGHLLWKSTDVLKGKLTSENTHGNTTITKTTFPGHQRRRDSEQIRTEQSTNKEKTFYETALGRPVGNLLGRGRGLKHVLLTLCVSLHVKTDWRSETEDTINYFLDILCSYTLDILFIKLTQSI